MQKFKIAKLEQIPLFINFLGFAKGSTGKVRSIFYIALDLNYMSKKEFDKNYSASVNMNTQISNFKKYLRDYTIKENIKKMEHTVFLLLKILETKNNFEIL